ncbi:MAG: toll/interleukin-1 receptor domain-containing protein [Anaerolineae bacterium]
MAEADLYNMSDVFISYSRRDSAFVHQLFDDIKATGKEVWADFEDIPKAADWWQEIKAGIDAADAFLFIISPDSVRSDVCRKEIEYAISSNKRLLPILYREIIEPDDQEQVHPAISSHNWIFFREVDTYEQAFQTLVESLETDLDHNRTLTRLLVRAREWQNNNKASSYLLQGGDLDQAEDWLAHAMNKRPAPTNLHAEYIQASREAAVQRQRRLFSIAIGGMIAALLLAVFAVYQMVDARQARDAAEVARQQAESAREQAEISEQEARALALSASASEALANNNPDLALVLAQAATDINTENPLVTLALADAAYAPGTIEVISVDDVPTTTVYARDGDRIATGFLSGGICLYDGVAYQEIACLQNAEQNAHSDSVQWLHMNDSATRLLSSGADNQLNLWDIDPDSATYGTLINAVTVLELSASALTSDGSFAVLGTTEGRFGYWDLASDSVEWFDRQHNTIVNVITINQKGDRALVGTGNGVMLEYDIPERALLNRYSNPNNRASISSVAYNPTNTIGVAGDTGASLTSWDLASGTIIRTYQGHDENVTAISFSANGRMMFTSSWDNSIREWDVASGRVVKQYYGHNGGINALSLTADNQYMVSGGFDSSMRVWLVNPIIYEDQLLSSDERLYSADWNANHIVAGNEAGELFIYTRNGELIAEPTEALGETETFSVDVHPNEARFVVVNEACRVQMFDLTGELLWTHTHENVVGICRQVGFMPDGERILTLSDGSLYSLDAENGTFLQTVPYSANERPNFRTFAITDDSTQALIGTNYRTENLRLIDLNSGEVVRDYVGHTDGVLAIDISDDGGRVVSGSFDNDVRIWDFATGEMLQLLEGHSDRLVSVEFNATGDAVVSASNDTTMRLWDLASGYTRYTYRGHTERVVLSTFSDGGDQILTASHDGTLIIWRLPQDRSELQTWIRDNRYLRELTCNERAVYLLADASCE